MQISISPLRAAASRHNSEPNGYIAGSSMEFLESQLLNDKVANSQSPAFPPASDSDAKNQANDLFMNLCVENSDLAPIRKRGRKSASKTQSIMDKSLMEVMLLSKRNELEMAVQRTLSDDDIIMKSNPKAPSRSPNSSNYRGVFKNGSKWQVSSLSLTL